ncbi:MAG: RluA family pseudouridine synthase [Chitinispirillaceae bacterium]|nr:RluA family pseudouridine synthase [Chitinispirillaceae bacterium]
MIFTTRIPVNITTPQPVVDYLAGRFTYHSHDTWTGLVASGSIRIDGRTATVHDTVRGNQTIAYDAGEFEEPPADLDYAIIYEDEWLLAVNKPGNLLIHRAGRSFRNNLMYHLRSVHTPSYATARCIHRLDRNTSGIVLVAKTAQLQSEIDCQFRMRTVHKWYDAIVEGVMNKPIDRIDAPIGRDASPDFRSRFRVDPAGKEAVTIVEQCEVIGPGFSQLLLKPLTGRTHQLRVHCAAIGHPVVGDRLYGSTVSVSGNGIDGGGSNDLHSAPDRHALHCAKIVFHHPRKNLECCIEAPLPADMASLREYAGSSKKKGGMTPPD